MGYFSNGSEGEGYVESYCYRCVHWKDLDDGRGPGCPVWDLHLQSNYKECGNKGSFLHQLIPRSKDGLYNEQCAMFHAKPPSLKVVRSA
jgi:hypothetical protein